MARDRRSIYPDNSNGRIQIKVHNGVNDTIAKSRDHTKTICAFSLRPTVPLVARWTLAEYGGITRVTSMRRASDRDKGETTGEEKA